MIYADVIINRPEIKCCACRVEAILHTIESPSILSTIQWWAHKEYRVPYCRRHAPQWALDWVGME